MNPLEMRVVVAEWVGWKRINTFGSRCLSDCGYLVPHWALGDVHVLNSPDYFNSLDAIHEAEQKLHSNWDLQQRYFYQLYRVVMSIKHSGVSGDFAMLNASASQRCEALCRMLWPERFGEQPTKKGG